MTLTVNGESREVAPAETVAGIVAGLAGSGEGRGVAVAVNGDVVPRSAWVTTVLRDGDAVEVLTAVQGG